MADVSTNMNAFLREWRTDRNMVKTACKELFAHMSGLPGLRLAYLYRPGISLSLRALPEDNPEKIVALLDIIDDDPEERWISLCFDASRVHDTEGMGDMVPQGLQGADAVCFDYDADNPVLLAYLKVRLSEAAAH